MKEAADHQKTIEHLATQISRQSQIQQNEDSKKVLGLLQDLQNPMTKMSLAMEGIHNKMNSSTMRKIIGWISSVPYERHRIQVTARLLSNSGEWLLRNPAFSTWRDSRGSSLFWLHGPPGPGKTTLL